MRSVVQPFPGPGGKRQISIAGGQLPVWSRNGRELFPESGQPHHGDGLYGDGRLFHPRQVARVVQSGTSRCRVLNYDLAPDGRRFAIFPELKPPAEEKGDVHVTFLLNFFDELRRRVPQELSNDARCASRPLRNPCADFRWRQWRGAPKIQVVLNWFEDVKQRVPGR